MSLAKWVGVAILASNFLYASNTSPAACEQLKKINPKSYESAVKSGVCGENSYEEQKLRGIKEMSGQRYAVTGGAIICKYGEAFGIDDMYQFFRDGTCATAKQELTNLKLVNYAGILKKTRKIKILKLENNGQSFWVEEIAVRRVQ